MSAFHSSLILYGDVTALTEWDNHYPMAVVSHENGECDCPDRTVTSSQTVRDVMLKRVIC